MRSMPSFILASLIALGACADGAPSDGEPDGPSGALADLDGKADGATSSELRARVGQLTVWMDVRASTDHDSPSGFRVVLEGRASRNLESVFSWVPDDAFGEATVVSARKFEIVLDEAHEINSVLSGAPLYLSIISATGTPREYYARVVVEPRFWKFEGSRDIYVREAVLPVYVRNGRDNLTYRGLVTTARDAVRLGASTDDDSDPIVRAVSGTRFELDWRYIDLALAMTPTTDPVYFSAAWKDPETTDVSKRARLAPTVVKLAMTTDDPYNGLVLERTCAAEVRACIADANGADDLGACGTYRDVSTCLASGPICGEDSADLELFPIAARELDASVDAFNAACPRGGSWCGVTDLAFFRLPECLEVAPDVEGLVAMLFNLDAYGGGQGGWQGATLDRADLLAGGLFGATGDEAASLLGTLDGWAGSMNAVHWIATQEVPCHNCHAWQSFLVVYYPESGRLFAILGDHGWDS